MLTAANQIISVWGSIRFRPRWESLNYNTPLPAVSILDREWAVQQSIYLVVQHSWNPSWNLGNGSEWGLFGPSRTCFWKIAILPRLNKHYFEMYQNCWYIAGASTEIQLVVLQRCRRAGLTTHMYADDIQSYLHSNPQESLQAVRSMKMALGQLEDWMKVNRLKLNQDKTQFMWIGRKQMLDKINREVLHSHFPDMKFLSSVNDLGVVLDERLEMEEQIGSICRSGFYHLRQIRGIPRSLSDVAARSAVQAFIMSKVDYCNSALLGLSATMVDRVQHLMNAAARLILRLPKFSHISAQMRDDLHWLPVQRRIRFKILLTTWRCISGSAPDYLQELCCLLSTIPGVRDVVNFDRWRPARRTQGQDSNDSYNAREGFHPRGADIMEYNTRGTSLQGDELHLGYCQKTAHNISLCSVRMIHCFFLFSINCS